MSEVTYPLIVTGMHRSGTTLLTRLLHRLGLHVGCDCRFDQMESQLLQEQNIRIFRRAGARWDRPRSMHRLLRNSGLSNRLVAELRTLCCSEATCEYLGAERYREHAALADQPQPWGWKDPRNTFTLPLWLKVFPHARVVSIHRNGVDVASSLRERTLKWLLSRGTKRLWLRQLKRLLPPPRCISLDYGFALWTDYVEMSLETTAALPSGQVRTVSYEALLERPMEILPGVAQFAGLPVEEANLAAAVADIRPERAYAFMNDPALVEFYRHRADHPLIRQLGYGDLLPEAPLSGDGNLGRSST